MNYIALFFAVARNLLNKAQLLPTNKRTISSIKIVFWSWKLPLLSPFAANFKGISYLRLPHSLKTHDVKNPLSFKISTQIHLMCDLFWGAFLLQDLAKGSVTPSPRSSLFSVLFSSLKNGVRKTRPFLEGKIGKTQKKISKIFIVPNRPKYHTDQLYTYKGYVDSVGFTEKRQKLSKWHISLIFDLF